MANSFLVRLAFIALLAGGVLAGCVQTKTTPGYARAGDHVVIGLGGLERNAQGEPILTASDLTITLTDFGSAQFSLDDIVGSNNLTVLTKVLGEISFDLKPKTAQDAYHK